ncbi:MAG: class I SAM-dependent methyltransferase [Candidatus Margulisbacteria bacterium]|jgi:predicted SAM-dependent methyltransferase|nr:class I SAM-dependent methyltransferase [Candidatus Margulisiibacteriota bacterium]
MSEAKLLKVDLCCGIRKPEGFVGVDHFPGENVDLVADLNERFPFEDNSVDLLRAHDAIEHLPDRIHTMNEIWRVCKPGATADIFVPSTDGRGAFQDPTHVSYWNINSFMYYSVDYPQTLELCRRYGFQGAFRIKQIFNIGDASGVVHVQAVLEAVK